MDWWKCYPRFLEKKSCSVGGGSHFQIPSVSSPQYFSVKYSPETRQGLTQHLDPIPILPNQLLVQAYRLRNRARIGTSDRWIFPPPPIPLFPPALAKDNVPESLTVAKGGIGGRSSNYYKQRTWSSRVKALYKRQPKNIKYLDFPRSENNIHLQKAYQYQGTTHFE